jgi:TrwC relaxase
VRRLLGEGDRYRDRLQGATGDEVVPSPSAYLLGTRDEGGGRAGSDAWSVPRDELDRFIASRRQARFRPGYDLTLRPPKSVSILWALAGADQRAEIRQAHREAVDEVVRYYEDRAVFARAGGGDRRLLASDGIVAAAFDHRTSRAGDPLLHTHVVTANMTRVQVPEKGVCSNTPARPAISTKHTSATYSPHVSALSSDQ